MDNFADRLAGFFRSLFGDDGNDATRRPDASAGGGFRDPDLKEAWEELDDYMRTGKSSTSSSSRQRTSTKKEQRPPDPGLRQDYVNLEVPFGADVEVVKKSYKSLMMKYHPDKYAGNPEKQKVALEITKKINESFERIRSRHES